MMSCEAEMCPYWTGDGCACHVFGIEDDERDLFKQQIRSEGLYPAADARPEDGVGA